YTTPWESYLISRGVWGYADGTVSGALFFVPVEELLFMVLQPVRAALWLSLLPEPSTPPVGVSAKQRLLGVGAGALVGVTGLALLSVGTRTFYLGAILAWAAPVLAVQWGFGWPYLWAARRTFVAAVAVPMLYLWIVDRVALQLGVWYISPVYTTGLTLGSLPVEEATFFLVTTMFVVQGLMLFLWVAGRWR
ncbi:MAG: lycopene cyclase domain-containing protein, partial [Halalkalicoccus sp.]